MGGTPKSSIFMGFPIQKKHLCKAPSTFWCLLYSRQCWASDLDISRSDLRPLKTAPEDRKSMRSDWALRGGSKNFYWALHTGPSSVLSGHSVSASSLVRTLSQNVSENIASLYPKTTPSIFGILHGKTPMRAPHIQFHITSWKPMCVENQTVRIRWVLSLSLKGMAQKLEHEEHSAVLLAATPDIGEH